MFGLQTLLSASTKPKAILTEVHLKCPVIPARAALAQLRVNKRQPPENGLVTPNRSWQNQSVLGELPGYSMLHCNRT